ncbi:hypothetical protein HBA54_16630 [Pelagibius litoralis]|uniref:Uncharacterized protein n=1 Tax=Pelagibius litoralis TaxID=374515 RepID=A0A967EZG9_9PROT|nr:hypothetical protein [Pelagibius litoralis]NIA70234.1 hypothetical protein [Pelagibius litoralis]
MGDRGFREAPGSRPRGSSPFCEGKTAGRRVNAELLRSQIGSLLKGRLPDGWIHQAITPGMPLGQADEKEHPDIIVISPAGRCYFLFTKAPADRWWDGDLRRVSAEALTVGESALMTRLKRGGYGVRAVWSIKDVERALANWGCTLRRGPAGLSREAARVGEAGRKNSTRAKLGLRFDKENRDDRP